MPINIPFLQNNFLAQSLDEESAKTSISTTFSNNLSNVNVTNSSSMNTCTAPDGQVQIIDETIKMLSFMLQILDSGAAG